MHKPLKRALDVMLALLGLIVGAPLMVLIALLIRLDSPGKAIFSQPRLGLHGHVFRMHKFRKFPGHWGSQGAPITVAADARMTRLGRILERTKLDELPQLWNILRGEMSFVGPRPESLPFKDLFIDEFAHVHDYVPGIFGPNQVLFRNESHLYPADQDPEIFYREQLFPRKAQNDLDYFSRATFSSDLIWVLRGLWCSIAGTIDWRQVMRRSGRILIADFVLIQLAWLGANLLRFEGLPWNYHWDVYLTGTWLMPLVVMPVMLLGGHYRSLARHFTAPDAVRLLMTGTAGWLLAYLTLLVMFERNASFGVGLIATVLGVFLMKTVRVFYSEYFRNRAQNPSPHADIDHAALLIYGAGGAGIALAGLLKHAFPMTRVVGFLDDNDQDLRGRTISGYPVLGSERDLDTLHAVYRLGQIWTTFEPNRFKFQRLTDWCERNAVRLVILPLTQPFLSLSSPSFTDWFDTSSRLAAASRQSSRVMASHSVNVGEPETG